MLLWGGAVHFLLFLVMTPPTAMTGKTVLITGSTDGIGLGLAKKMHDLGHTILLHGRNMDKLNLVAAKLGGGEQPNGVVEIYAADLSQMDQVDQLAQAILAKHSRLDVLVNNAGIFKTPQPYIDGLDVRFSVNTIAPYLLTKRLLPIISQSENGRIVNVSSAAQQPVQLNALRGELQSMDDFGAYAQSKLAITAWSHYMAAKNKVAPTTTIVSVNPGSLLATKMVQEGFNTPGRDINLGIDILLRCAIDNIDGFGTASDGKYFDNDTSKFQDPHPEVFNLKKTEDTIHTMDKLLKSKGIQV